MAFLIGGANSDSGAYEISNSLRLEDGDSPELSFSVNESPTHQDKGTWSFWIKRGNILSAVARIFSAYADSGATQTWIRLDAADKLDICNRVSSSNNTRLVTNRVFRDPSAWYHIVVAFDTSDGTAGNRVKVYINGVEETSFGTETNPSQNDDLEANTSGIPHSWGCDGVNDDEYFDGYLSEVYFIDGSQKAASDFGKTNDNGVWIPKQYAGSYGTNGYRLQFKQTGTSANASGIGADTSGNGKHFTLTNLAATDITTDTPSNNFATLNPLVPPFSQTNYTLSEGNLKYVTGLNQPAGVSTMAMANGKWYWEIKKGSTVDNPAFGVVGSGYVGTFGGESYGDADSTVIQAKSTYIENGDRIGYSNNGSDVYKNGSAQSYGSFDAIASGDIFMVALDMDNLKIWFGNNGTWLGSGDPAAGSNNVATLTDSSFYLREEGSQLAAVDSPGGENVDWEINFGNPTFAISSGNADANGYGNFEYAVPSGFYALCTKNLAEYG